MEKESFKEFPAVRGKMKMIALKKISPRS